MKLGDNMTMEAYNIWGNVPPRKCRPPRIGDIPKHGAVDEESPGSSTKKLTISPSDTRDSALDISLDLSKNTAFPLDSTTSTDSFSPIPKFETRQTTSTFTEKVVPHYTEKEPRNAQSSIWESKGIGEESIKTRKESFVSKLSRPEYLKDQGKKRLVEPGNKITIKLSSTEELAKVRIKSPSNEAQDLSWIPSSPEDISEREIVEVRKDSALFLEEEEGLPALREILKSTRSRIARPRRESSGYASNLGTFDEDRRNSTSGEILQDLSSFLKERRRSSTKRLNSRITIGKAEESLTEEIGNSALDRMPTTEIYRKVSSAGLEMPNIQEVKEVLRDELPSGQESLDNLCDLKERVGTEELSTRCHVLGKTSNHDSSLSGDVHSKLEVLENSKKCITPKLPNTSMDVFDMTSFNESIDRVSTALTSSLLQNTSNRTLHQYSHSSSPALTSQNINQKVTLEKPCFNEECTIKNDNVRSRTLNITTAKLNETEFVKVPIRNKNEIIDIKKDDRKLEKVLPKPIKVYQLLSTQSEDRVDGEPNLTDRRISLQISKHDDESLPMISSTESNDTSLRETVNVSTSKNSTACDLRVQTEISLSESMDGSPVRKLSSPGEMGTQKFLGDVGTVTVRPIYPYCPYSPYGSPQGSPRNRRRPLRESRRVSIDNRQGALQLNQYKLLDNIGQGSYGIVKLVYNEEDETHYAMKILSKKKLMKKAGIFGRMAPGRKGAANPLAKVYREIALLKKLDHPNVVKLVEVLDDPDEDNLYLVFELVQKGEVLQVPTDKPLDEETARKNFRDVVMGVEYLHYQRIVHRDIKPSNLLVDSDGRIKIADLGVSAELRASGELLSGPAGTPAFAAPETTTPGAHYSGTPCDIWSMGVTLYCLVTGKVPWDGAGSIIGVQAAVRTEPLKFPDCPLLTNDLCELISRMLAKDPTERITLPEIKEHPWLTNHGAEPLPSEADNCRLPVTVTDEEVERVVTKVPKLDTLILIKTMLKQHSFQNPFLAKKTGRNACNEAGVGSLELSARIRTTESLTPKETIRNVKSERFQKSGRSNSAPDSYDWQTNGRQISVDSPLPPVTEVSSQESETERR